MSYLDLAGNQKRINHKAALNQEWWILHIPHPPPKKTTTNPHKKPRISRINENMVFWLNYGKSTPVSTATTTTKTNSFGQHFKRWIGWRPRKSQQNIPSAQYNNYLMISSCTDESIHHCTPSIPNDDQSTIFETTQSDTNYLQQLQHQKPYDEGLARLSNCTTEFSHFDNTLHTGSYSSGNAASANRRRPALIDTNITRHKVTAASTYSRLTGPLTTSAFSDMTNSTETSPLSANSVQQALPLSPSWDQELQQGRMLPLLILMYQHSQTPCRILDLLYMLNRMYTAMMATNNWCMNGSQIPKMNEFQ
ncbi:unnamed protein product [Absidia cylindrospora]